jgi:hypothetical protein
MTAAKYPQKAPDENSLGLHYSRFQPLYPHRSSAYLSKNPKAEVESAKLGLLPPVQIRTFLAA